MSRPHARDAAIAPLRVVHRDDHLLVVDKPSGIVTTSPHANAVTLTSLVAAINRDAPRTHATSRLDREVSGLVTFARTDRAIAALMEARREGRYRRTYLAIVERSPAVDEGEWTWPIAIDPRDPTHRIALREGEHGEREQTARTRYVVRGHAHESSLLALYPETGRTHQLRVHSAAAGHPVVGDESYRGRARIALANGRIVTARRVMLHCAMLALPDVARGEGTIELTAEAGEDVARVWGALGGDASALSLG